MAKIKGSNNDNDLFGRSSNDIITGLGGDDFIFGAAGNDKINAGGGDDEVIGGKGNDKLTGGAGNDHVLGGAGNDVLNGNLDNDILSGGAGNDTLIGGAGRDVMTGGQGDDIFKFLPGTETPPGIPNAEVITDFEQIAGAGGDKLQLPAGSNILYSQGFKISGFDFGWYIEYGGGGNIGFVLLDGLLTAPDYEFV